jgi:hypothetical protein
MGSEDSTRRPLKRTTAEEMEMELGNGFAGIFAIVEDEPVSAIGNTFASGDCGCGEEDVPQNGLILRRGETDTRDGFAWDNEDMDGCLRSDVAEGEAVIIFKDDVCGNFAGANFLE